MSDEQPKRDDKTHARVEQMADMLFASLMAIRMADEIRANCGVASIRDDTVKRMLNASTYTAIQWARVNGL